MRKTREIQLIAGAILQLDVEIADDFPERIVLRIADRET
jgi:hypothetical protein